MIYFCSYITAQNFIRLRKLNFPRSKLRTFTTEINTDFKSEIERVTLFSQAQFILKNLFKRILLGLK